MDLEGASNLPTRRIHFTQDGHLLFELIFVSRVLIMTTAAACRNRGNLAQPLAGSACSIAEEFGMKVILRFHRRLFAGEHERRQHDATVHAARGRRRHRLAFRL